MNTPDIAKAETDAHPRRRALSWTVFVFLAAASASSLIYPVQDADLFWHLVIGRWIRAHGSLPTTEHWNYFGLGRPFRAYSWLSEICFSAVEEYFGWNGLFVLQAMLAVSLAAALTALWLKLSKSLAISLLMTGFFCAPIHPFVVLRPQVVTFLAFAGITAAAEFIARRGKLEVKSTVIIILLFALWANNHIAMILGLGWLGGWLLIPEKRSIRLTFLTLAAAFAGTLITPYGIGIWLTFLFTSGHVNIYKNFIIEFASVGSSSPFFPFWAGCAAAFIAVCIRGERSPIFRKAVTASFLLLGLYAVKFIPFALMTSLTFIARYGYPLWDKPLARLIRLLRRPWLHVPRTICWILAVFPCAAALGLNAAAIARMPPLQRSLYPERTLDFVLEQKFPGPILMVFGRGGYLMHRLADAAGNVRWPVAIDGRTNILSAEEMRMYMDMDMGNDDWQKFIRAYSPGTIVWPLDAPLTELLRAENEWREVENKEASAEGLSIFTK